MASIVHHPSLASGRENIYMSLISMNLTLAHIAEPDVSQSAGSPAVDAFDLVGSDDNVGEGGTVGEDEDSIRAAGVVGVAGACNATVELLVAVILGASDGDGLTESLDVATTSGDDESLSGAQSGEGQGSKSVMHCCWRCR